jgi:hypothetical protein
MVCSHVDASVSEDCTTSMFSVKDPEMEVAGSSELSVPVYQTTRCHNP